MTSTDNLSAVNEAVAATLVTSFIFLCLSELVWLNEVALSQTWLVPGWVTVLGWLNHQHTTRHAGLLSLSHPSAGRQYEYWLWLRPPLGKNGKSCVTVGPVTRTAGILACSRLNALAVNGTGHPADVGNMLA